MDYEQCSGGIVLRKDYLVLVCDARTGLKGFPKGHVEEGETLEETAMREVYEETGIKDLEKIKRLGSYIRRNNHSNLKKITLYEFRTFQTELNPINEEVTSEWVLIRNVLKKLSYDEDRDFFLKILKKHNY